MEDVVDFMGNRNKKALAFNTGMYSKTERIGGNQKLEEIL